MTNKLLPSSFHRRSLNRRSSLPTIDTDNVPANNLAAPSGGISWNPVSDYGGRKISQPSRAGATATTDPISVTSSKAPAATCDNDSSSSPSSGIRRARRNSAHFAPTTTSQRRRENFGAMMPRHKGNVRGSLDETSLSTSGGMLPRLPSTEPPESSPARAANSSYRLSQRRSLSSLPKADMITSPTGIQAQSPVVTVTTSPPQTQHQATAGRNLPAGNTSPCSAAANLEELLPMNHGSQEHNSSSRVVNGPSFITQSRRRLQPLLLTSDGTATREVSNVATKSMSHIERVSPLLRSETTQPRGKLVPRKVKSCIGEDLSQGNPEAETPTGDDDAPADDGRSLRRIRQPRRSVTFVLVDTSSANDAKDPLQRTRSSLDINSFADNHDGIMEAVAAYDIDSAGVEDPRQALADSLGSVLVGELFAASGPAVKDKWEIESDLMAQREIEEIRMKAAAEEKAMMVRQERQREELRRQMEEVEAEKKKMLFNSVKNVAGRVLERMKSWKNRAVLSSLDDEDIAASTRDVELERRVEAVFVSYALYGYWNPHEAAMWLPQDCKGLACDKFLDLARDAKLLKQSITLQEARNIFCKHNNMETGYIEFQNFFIAISELAELDNKEALHGITSVLKLNAEEYMLIHGTSDVPSKVCTD